MTAAAVAVIVAARKRVIQNLRDQGAYSLDTAAPVDLHRGLERRILDRLQRSGVVIPAGAGRYYLDLASLEREKARARQGARVAAGVLTGIAAVALLAALL